MGLFAAIAAYSLGQRRQRRRGRLEFCDRCGQHITLHIGRDRTCPTQVLVDFYLKS